MTPQQATSRFHYAFAISGIERAREFYVQRLGCAEGRSTDHWIDFELFGHQLSAHLGKPAGASCEGTVDGHAVPIPHFGAILEIDQFWKFAEQLRAAGIGFLMEPALRFVGKPGEQATMFFLDPDGNALEFKAFVRADEVFVR
ncbi:MAG: VOC family protein [Rhodocyclales bacterium]|nr:VOC family protein [Rhodocyclales bacterium]